MGACSATEKHATIASRPRARKGKKPEQMLIGRKSGKLLALVTFVFLWAAISVDTLPGL
jgi:hypothetical protein